jgi:HEAT repeat protein
MRHALSGLFVAAVLAGSACKTDPATPEHWEKRLGDAKNKATRVRIIDELRGSKFMTPAMVPMLVKRLQAEKAPEVKASVARVLGEQKSKEAVEALLDTVDLGASETDTKAMNKEVLNALASIGDMKAVPTFKKFLTSKDNFSALAAIDALGELKAKDAFDDLYKLANDSATEPFVVKKAITALGELGDARAVPGLVKLMFFERKDRGISFYAESSFALYQLGKPAADALVPVIDEKDAELKAWAEKNNVKSIALPLKAAQVLGDLHEMRAEKALMAMVNPKTEFADVKGLMQMKGADGLGRMRSKDGAKALAAQMNEEEPAVRREMAWGLIRIGGRDAMPKLIESLGKGAFEARTGSVRAVAMLGDEREMAAFEKAKANEAKMLDAECKEVDDEAQECKAKDAEVKKRTALISGYAKRLEAGKECKADATCWVKKLDDSDAGVRERAAYELGRSNNPAVLGDLMKHLRETDLDARLAAIQGVDWLVHDNKEAAAQAKAKLGELEKQLADEKGKTDFIKTNEDLRRLKVKIQNS